MAMQLLVLIKVVNSVVLLCIGAELSKAELFRNFEFRYETFNRSHYKVFTVHRSALINNNSLQLTTDVAAGPTAYKVYRLSYRVGRVVFRRKFKLWDADSTQMSSNTSNISNSSQSRSNTSKITTASFNTSFLINIYPVFGRGEGLAFLIASNRKRPRRQSFGGYLGLTNATYNGIPNKNRFIAVEFDTRKQEYDPDDNHVGLNLNRIESEVSESLSPHGIELVSDNQTVRFYQQIWIQYDGEKKVIEVYIAQQSRFDDPTPPKPKSPILRSDLDLQDRVDEYSYFGFSASNGDGAQVNSVLRWSLSVKYLPDKKGPGPGMEIGLGAGIPAGIILVTCASAMGWYLIKRKRRMNAYSRNIVEALRKLPGMPREYEFRDLKKATDNFDEKCKLGKGGYGVVYKGMLEKENLEVAIKWFSRNSLKGEDDFLAELTIINRLRHKHLVPLLGWCHKNGKLLLVYEYMPNGSLDMHLFRGSPKGTLSWDLRYKIASGIASALNYLHIDFDQCVVHRDLKPSNIMLDSEFNARLGDFGLARALDKDKTSYTEAEGVHGTLGYIAPECFHTGKTTQQSDIYAFGTVLIELVCGQKLGTTIGDYYLLSDWVWSLFRKGCLLDAVDEKLGGEFVAEEAERILLLGLACSHPIASERPKTQQLVQIILGSVPVPDVPHVKPSFVWPATMWTTNTSSLDSATKTTSYASCPFNGVEVSSTSVEAKSNVPHTK